MFDDLGGLFYENLVPLYEAYRESRRRNDSGRNKRLQTTIQAAAALSHFREHLPPQHAKSWSSVVAECPEYRLLAAVTNAAKHKNVTRKSSERPPLIATAAHVGEQLFVTLYEDGEGQYSDSRVSVMAKCTDGTTRNVDLAIVLVFNYWREMLNNLGAVSYPRCELMDEPEVRFVTRNDASAPNFEVLNVVRWRTAVQIGKYDAVTGRSNPVDLTGAIIEMNIYRPAYELAIDVNLPGRPAPVSCILKLTDEQAQFYHAITSVSEREEFVKALARERQSEIETMLTEALTKTPST